MKNKKNFDTLNSFKYKQLKEFINKQTRDEDIYLTAGGYYQEKYIAIFEELTADVTTGTTEERGKELYVTFIANLFVDKLINKFPDKNFPFNKILTVTLPSQMIAKAIHDELKKRHDINYYQNNSDKEYSTEYPKLIALSSYYSYYEEMQFKSISAKDKVLIVNDVISTGSLIKDIAERISLRKEENNNSTRAKISCVLSVIDSRIPNSEIDCNKHKSSIFFNDESTDLKESDFIILEQRKISKFKLNPSDTKTLVRINPILNARITTKLKNSEEDKIVFKDSEKFLEYIPLKAMVIGHFKENALHHQYFFKPEILFEQKKIIPEILYDDHSASEIDNESFKNGIKLIRAIFDDIKTKEKNMICILQ